MEIPATIPALVEAAGQEYADREAIVDGDVRLTFAELAARVRDAGAAYISAGVKPGDPVGLWAPNSVEWVIAALGLLAAGGILVPINTRFKGDEAAYLLAKTRATALVSAGEFLGTDYVALLRASDTALPHLTTHVVLDDKAPDGTVAWPEFLAAADTSVALPVSKHDDLSDIIFTSGTTGRPKGVMVTHAQSLRVFDTWSDIVGLQEGDRYLVVNPFFHTFGYKAGILACLMRGATIVPEPVFDVDRVLARIGEERISVIPGPPTLYQSILDHPRREEHDLSSLRLAVTGAAVVPVVLVERMRDELSFDTVLTAYGLTESTGTATMCRRDDDPETIATTSGRAIPDTEVRIDAPEGDPGEVLVRGYNVMLGYFEDDEETAKTIDSEGWLHTGDVGVMDDRGNVRITDRIKDMFVVGGFNAYPAEIEQVLARHPGVAEAAVVGVPDERLGEVGRAFVVPKPGASVHPDEVVAWCRDQMANYKVPRAVVVVDVLPRNASGKVLKFELREGTA
ncbi:MAG: HIP---CoA ligase [Frankiales bacterium]|jgi:acyl-CoA synthetase (AMP-forming)/AMP-acid ligase II|nr:HIP---CoA ligase [Frankiales bacterium]